MAPFFVNAFKKSVQSLSNYKTRPYLLAAGYLILLHLASRRQVNLPLRK